MTTNTSPKIDRSARAGGERLKRAVHVARARAGIDSDVELAQRAHVHYDTLLNWYAGRTTPRPAMVKAVASVLGVQYASLLDAYDGRDPEPPELREAVTALIDEIRSAMVDERRARAQLMRAIAAAVSVAMGEPVGVMDRALSVANTSSDGNG